MPLKRFLKQRVVSVSEETEMFEGADLRSVVKKSDKSKRSFEGCVKKGGVEIKRHSQEPRYLSTEI